MPSEDDKGSFSADIPQDLLDKAVEAVEKRHHDDSNESVVFSIGEAPERPVEAVEPGEPGEVERLRAELEMAQERARETFERLKEEHDRHLRAAADLDNFKKRAAREREEIQRFANERLVKELLPVVDNLDRALGAAAPDDPLAGGVKLVLKGLEEVLARHGVKSFHALGLPFDPKVHEAILTVPTDEQPPGIVVLEHGRGFTLSDRLIRPALVGVSAPSSGSAPPDATG